MTVLLSMNQKVGTLDAMPATLLNNNQPLNGNISMEIHSADEDKSKTPKSYVRF